MLARTSVAIPAIAIRTADDSFGIPGPLAAAGALGSMESALDGLAALRAELHVPWDFVPVGALDRLGRAALPAELEARWNGLAALHARLADRARVRAAVPAELRRHGVLMPAFRAGLRRLLPTRTGGEHAGHLGAHRVPHADPGPEPDAGAGAATRIRGRVPEGIRRRELLIRRRVRAAEHLRGGHLLEGRLDRLGQGDVHPVELEDLHAEVREVRLRVREGALLDVVQRPREVDDPKPARLHLAEGHVELLHELLLDPLLGVGRGRGPERPDELIDEDLGVLVPVPEVPEGAELDHVKVRILEEERLLRAELSVEDALLEVEDLRLLHDAGKGLDEPSEDRRVLRRQGVPVRAVEVREDLPVAVEDRDLVLPHDDVVVHADVPRDLPHDVPALELVIPRDRRRADDALAPARRLIRPPCAAEEECNRYHVTSPSYPSPSPYETSTPIRSASPPR